MDRKQITDSIVNTIENDLRNNAPEGKTAEEIEAILTLNRVGLVTMAIKIADGLIADGSL
jgi:hypothetical protein